MMLLFLSTNILQAQSLWVGETYKCDATSAVMGLTSDVSWTTSGGYIQLSGSGFYRNAKVTQYFSGSATVKCSWKYRLYSGDSWKTMSRSWNISCKDNPASINPTSMTLASGETGYVGYSFSYSNSYTSNAEPYFSSSNPNVATVSTSGEVTAKIPALLILHYIQRFQKFAVLHGTCYGERNECEAYCCIFAQYKGDKYRRDSETYANANSFECNCNFYLVVK